MKIFGTESNEQVLKELGQRLKDTRISMSYTQKEMAERVAEIRGAVSYYTMTKLFIAAFLWGAYLLWRGKIFAE